ncbi:pyridine nucleotide-disulfide oxidoreductase [Nibricoccus aquaticus]|uniref:Pyridine nucleotide-disulfide oxidoreductase n=1 Tax=Nibricoccus aquaticus TaxID=2576891 RepID=A0A290QN58_9BACT|nr:NAD(P)/FAD-dependent oxidoreductase [Nibricoccus aquaticus]ATC65692.1 pyridine nucleotide-disulfide oxidoreductase [Nibricoccus aquaticus]
MKSYDFLVIGGGSAGFNAARVAHSLGKKVAIVDGAKELGGLCILRGCMPSKTLLYIAEILHLAQKGKTFGLKIPRASADMKAIHARKKKIIGEFASYRDQAMHSGKYDLYRAHARFLDPHTVELSDGKKIRAKKILIATGSRVSTPSIPGLAETPAWTSDDVLDLDFIPKSVLVLGGGIVATELAQFLNRIGSRVTLIQRSAHILKDHSPAASETVQQAFRDEGIELLTGTSLEKISGDKRGVTVRFTQGKKTLIRRAAHLFNALGREPNTAGLSLENAGVKLTASGRVVTNRFQQTTAPHIYAGGDVAGPHDIVHLAVAQGELAARHAFGVKKLKPVDHSLLLNVVFTDPQLASIGALESDLKKSKTPHLVASYPFNDHGKSILMDANYGYVKVIAEPRRGRILGAEIVGKDAGELIHCFSGPLAMKATVFDLLRAPWYHPTLAEIITYPLEEIADQIS